MPDYRRPDSPSPSLTLADHARAWDPPGPDPGFQVDQFLNEARATYRIRQNDPLPTATAAAAESERPGVLPVAPVAPGPQPEPDALAALCHALGVEFHALAEALREGKGWDDGHRRRLRGAIEAAGHVLDAGPRAEREGEARRCS